MIKGLTDFSNDNMVALKKLVVEGYTIKTVTLTDESYIDSYVLLQHPETRVTIKVLLDNYFFEEFAKEYLVRYFNNTASVPIADDTTSSDYYQLKLSLGDD
jgi:hypothetical protein